MDISVIIPTYNRPAYLLQTIREVIDQQHAAVAEIIVIDQTPQHALPNNFFEQLEGIKQSTNLVYQQKDLANLPAARNTALALARGDIALMLDDDVLLPPGFIQEHLNCYHQNNRVIGVAGLPYHRKKESLDQIDTINMHNFRQYTSPHFTANKIDFNWQCHMVGANHSFLVAFGRRSGGYDEQFIGVSFYEDTEFAANLMRQFPKHLICYNPNAYNIHLRAVGGVRITKQSTWTEEQLITGPLIYGWRYLKGWGLIKHVLSIIRIGPLRKKNIVNFWRQPAVWYAFIKVLVKTSSKHKKRISPFP